ncbi:Protein of unknown function DUF869, plant [Cynara cardunculus var. scolymus]|uniref:Filament-like plant protein n=1 Tax=Cynara cardunculus var. scolymus TaxID=59895 RepID=A0A118JT59_CYNCS|nr:Protein of unknown function DUF869, plant [Cynara cardunculus var. scolymus]
MDRRSWLWRRKSSEKSPGETESSGGSVSSHSERFSDDQAELPPEELDGGINALSEKLSTALLNISIKEDMLKQHSKVAEEAVEGWEKAENEVLALRQQSEVLTLRNSTLEDRVCQLDGALKECLRQLRQTREERDEKVDEAIEKKTSEWQITKTELEKQLADLRSQLQSAKKTEASLTSIETAEKENSALKLELASMAEELEIRFIERELSNQAAEQASKLHLESIKKAAKFEAECRRLNAALRKALVANDQRSFTDSQSIVESDDFKFESNQTTPTMDINLMDDFLEMERLAALPSDPRDSEPMIDRRSEIEEMLKRVEMEKTNLEVALNEREIELNTSKNQLKDVEAKLVKMEDLLIAANDARDTAEKELESAKATGKALHERAKRSKTEVVELKSQLDIICNERREAESRLEDAYTKKSEAESRVRTLESKLESLVPKVASLETKVEKERALSGRMGAKCRELEDEISRLQLENQYPKADIRKAEMRVKQDTELALAGSKYADCQKTIASLSRQLKTLATLEDFLIDTNEFNRRI